MTGFPLANFSASEQGLFSPAEIQHLMRIEHARSQRYGYPVGLLLIEVDRLELLHDLYGVDSEQEILDGVVKLLRSVTRGSDFVGCLVDDRLMALFPHTSAEGAAALAGRLLRASRRLAFESDGRSLRATLSIGVSVSQPWSATSFEELVESAVEALRFAMAEGGDRFVQRQPASAFFDDLRQELDEEVRLLDLERRGRGPSAPPPEPGEPPAAEEAPAAAAEPEPPPAPAVPEGPPDEELAEGLRALFRDLDPSSPDLARLEEEVVAVAQRAVELARGRAAAEAAGGREQKIDLLERRVSKLKELLDSTEAELVRIARAKGVDTGIASIYRTVQGLSAEEESYTRKKEMLTVLFEANVELRKKIQGRS